MFNGPRGKQVRRDKPPEWARAWILDIRNVKASFNCINAAVATGVIAAVIAVAAIIVGGIALGHYDSLTGVKAYVGSGRMLSSPFSASLDAAGAPLTLTLTNALITGGGYARGVDYAIYSTTAQPHVVSIDLGALGTTWDGTNRIATLGGAPGDGFTFRVLGDSLISLGSVNNVAFS